MNYTFTNDDIAFIERAIELKNKGFFIDGKQVTDVYNRVLQKRANPTNCGSCIRQRISELEAPLNSFKAKMGQESVPEVKVDNTPQDENKAVVEARNDEIKARMAKVRAAKKNNKK